MIKVEGVTKKYGSNYAVKDLSFTIDKGKVYGFLGPNGAGKSTTMNIITGYLAASSGTVTVDGHDILKDAEEAKKCIGYLPEIPPLYPDMTVFEYLKFVAELKKIPSKDRKTAVEDVMGKTMISDMRNRMIKNLSKGYKQRVGLAQAILGNPEVIILDEPTVGLDPKQIIEIRELILELKKNHTIILSSHILAEVSAVCDHIMIISKGKLVAADTADNLEKLMAGETRVELEVPAEKEALSKVLDTIEGIKEYSIGDKDDEGILSAEIAVGAQEEIRKDLSIKLANAGIPVYKLVINKKSLEDIFLELTENEQKDSEQAQDEESSASEQTQAEAGSAEQTAEGHSESKDEVNEEVAENDSNL